MDSFQTHPIKVRALRVTKLHTEGQIPFPPHLQEAIDNQTLIPGKTARIDQAHELVRFYMPEGTVVAKRGDWIIDPFDVMDDESFRATYIAVENTDES